MITRILSRLNAFDMIRYSSFVIVMNVKISSSRKRTNLIFVQFTVFELRFSLFTERDDDEAHEDVHHEEGDDDDVDDEEDGDLHAVVVDGTHILSVGVDGLVQQTETQKQTQTN